MHPVLFQIGSLLVPSYGACAAFGVLLALALAQHTARRTGLDPRHTWNILILAIFSSIAVSRLLLIVLNFSDLRRHPSWLLAIAMVHHPLLGAVGVAGAAAALLLYVRWAELSWKTILDSLAAPISVGLAAEQFGALLAGSDFGRDSASNSVLGAVTYSSELAARWSGTPLGVPLYPVQAYACLGAILLAGILYGSLSVARRAGDTAALWLCATGVLLFLTEIFRDWEGRGVLLGGLIDIPQLVGLGLVLLGGAMLLEWRSPAKAAGKAYHV